MVDTDAQIAATISIQSIEEAQAQNAANRGPANRYRAMTVGLAGADQDGDEHEEEFFLVVSEAYTALDMTTGNGVPFASCESIEDAELVASLLNKHFAA